MKKIFRFLMTISTAAILLCCLTAPQVVQATDSVDPDSCIHVYDGWSHDNKGHWRSCTLCGYSEQGFHVPGPGPTEAAFPVCAVCGNTVFPGMGHMHDFASSWTASETGHWQACRNGCLVKANYGTHIFDNDCDTDCSVCGFARIVNHIPEDTWTTSSAGHWYACSNGCEEKDSYGTHIYKNRCDTDCSVCGFTRITKHAPDGVWNAGETTHWQLCSACKEKNLEEAHIPGTAATATTAQTCTVCNYELAPATGKHLADLNFPWWLLIVVPLVVAVVVVMLILKKKKKG